MSIGQNGERGSLWRRENGATMITYDEDDMANKREYETKKEKENRVENTSREKVGFVQ